MSVSRVRHHGQPPVPRGELGPADVDHGPSSGRGQGRAPGIHAEVARIAHAEASKLTEVGGRLPGGSGAIERRMATKAQREAWRAADVDDAPQTLTVSPGLQRGMHIVRPQLRQSRIEVIAGGRYESRRSIAVTPSPEPVIPEEPMAVEPPPPVITRSPETQALLELAAATSRTDAAWEALHAADVARIRADEEYQLAHQELAGAIATVTDVLGPAVADELATTREDEAVAAALRDDRLGDEPDDAPEVVSRRPEPKPAAGGGPGRPAYVARMLNAMVDAGGDFTVAADALQIKRSSLVGSMSVLRSRTDLTEAEAAAIARTRVRKA